MTGNRLPLMHTAESHPGDDTKRRRHPRTDWFQGVGVSTVAESP